MLLCIYMLYVNIHVMPLEIYFVYICVQIYIYTCIYIYMCKHFEKH